MRKQENEQAQKNFHPGDTVCWPEANDQVAHGTVLYRYGKEYVVVRSLRGKHLQQVECAELHASHLTKSPE